MEIYQYLKQIFNRELLKDNILVIFIAIITGLFMLILFIISKILNFNIFNKMTKYD